MARLFHFVTAHSDGSEEGYKFWCPSCDEMHRFRTKAPNVLRSDNKPWPVWKFDGNMEFPTFTPSLRSFYTEPDSGAMVTLCHLTLTAGKITYHGDQPKDRKGLAWAGRVVDLPTPTAEQILSWL
jgi:hypothetical protein